MACLALDLVVAWRIFHLTKLSRETPEVPCTVYFAEHEWPALVGLRSRPKAIVPENPPSLNQAVRLVASLVGFLGRKGDGEPGTQMLWLGLQRLDDLVPGWCLRSADPALVQPALARLRPPTVSSNPAYG